MYTSKLLITLRYKLRHVEYRLKGHFNMQSQPSIYIRMWGRSALGMMLQLFRMGMPKFCLETLMTLSIKLDQEYLMKET